MSLIDAKISMLEQAVGETTLNARYDSLEEMRDGERQKAKENRKVRPREMERRARRRVRRKSKTTQDEGMRARISMMHST
jgi:hypothetical protein